MQRCVMDRVEHVLLVQCLCGLTDTAGETVVDECGLQHLGQGGVDIHHTSGSNAVGMGKNVLWGVKGATTSARVYNLRLSDGVSHP